MTAATYKLIHEHQISVEWRGATVRCSTWVDDDTKVSSEQVISRYPSARAALKWAIEDVVDQKNEHLAQPATEHDAAASANRNTNLKESP